MKAIAQLESVTKRYRDTTVLNNVSLNIAPGEFLAITGRSGSGKSTLLRILGTLEPADSGIVRIGGADTATMSESDLAELRRNSIGYVFQAFNLIETLTIAENIELPLQLKGLPAQEIRGRVHELLEQLGIAATADRFPDSVSGGEQQRTAIARALSHRPGLIIADEPTGNLDEATARTVMDLLIQMCAKNGSSLVVATHSDELRQRADRQLRVAQGSLEVTQ